MDAVRPLTLLRLSPGWHRALADAGFTLVEQLEVLTPAELRDRTPGLGSKGLRALGQELARLDPPAALRAVALPTAPLVDPAHEVAASDAFGRAWVSVYGEAYRGWDLHRGRSSKDRQRRAELATAARLAPLADQGLVELGAVAHLEQCTERYLRAHLAGAAFPKGAPTSFAAWCSVAGSWLAKPRVAAARPVAEQHPAQPAAPVDEATLLALEGLYRDEAGTIRALDDVQHEVDAVAVPSGLRLVSA